MAGSGVVMPVGAVCFGLTVGYITYRTLVRTADKAAITDLAAVVGAIGGGAVTGLFNPSQGDLFGWYSIGLVAGVAVFFLVHLKMNGRDRTAAVMSLRTMDASGLADKDDRAAGPQALRSHRREACPHPRAPDLVSRSVAPQRAVRRAGNAVHLVDLDTAMPLDQPDVSYLTDRPVIVDMAPELTDGEGADERADLYSLGATMYEMAAGRPPFTGSREEILTAAKIRRRRILGGLINEYEHTP